MEESKFKLALKKIAKMTSQGDLDEEEWMENMCMEPADSARTIQDINQIAVEVLEKEGD